MAGWIEQIINDMGYWGLAFLMFLENVFPPIPSEVVMPLGGFLSTQQLAYGGVVLAGTAGSVLGAFPLYYLGKLLTPERLRSWADQYGRWIALTPEEIDTAMAWFEKHGKAAVFFCRMIPGIRSLISIPAGVYEMNLGTFTLLTALGAGIWSAALAYAGRALGKNYQQVGQYLGPIGYAVLGFIVLTIVWNVVKGRREKKDEGGESEEPATEKSNA